MLQLEKLFLELKLHTPEQCAAYVNWMLGKDDRSCPFYYKECEDGKTLIVRCMPCMANSLTMDS
jgi:hypothetical protein